MYRVDACSAPCHVNKKSSRCYLAGSDHTCRYEPRIGVRLNHSFCIRALLASLRTGDPVGDLNCKLVHHVSRTYRRPVLQCPLSILSRLEGAALPPRTASAVAAMPLQLRQPLPPQLLARAQLLAASSSGSPEMRMRSFCGGVWICL